MKLYELDQEIEKIETIIDAHLTESYGDLTTLSPSYEHMLSQLTGERNHKLLNLAAWHKNVSADVTAYANEIKTLQHKKRIAENKAEWLSGFIESFLSPSEKIKDARVALSWRKSEKLAYSDGFDPAGLPIPFQRITCEVNATDLKEAIRGGEKFEGVSLEQRENLQIK